MSVILATFTLSRKTPCDKDGSKICLSGAVNSSKQRLITSGLISSIPGLLLELRENNASFSLFTKTVQPRPQSIFFSLPALNQFLQKSY